MKKSNLFIAIIAVGLLSSCSNYSYYQHTEEDDVYFTKATNEEIDGYAQVEDEVDDSDYDTYRQNRRYDNRRYDRRYNNRRYRTYPTTGGTRTSPSTKGTNKPTPTKTQRPSSRPSSKPTNNNH